MFAWKAYQRSKLANILFTRELARRLKRTGVTANCLHPGFVASGFGDNNRGLWRLIFAIAKRVSAIPVERGAETPVYVASSRELDGTSGKYFDKCQQRAPTRRRTTMRWRSGFGSKANGSSASHYVSLRDCSRCPGGLVGLASLPLKDIEASLGELDR